MKQKFYYIDENGKKKKYVGKIDKNADGTYTGYLTQGYKTIEDKFDLTFVPAVESVVGHPSFFTYTNNAGEEIRFTGWPRFNGTTYEFTYFEYVQKELSQVPAVENKSEYYTYIVNGEEHLWGGEVNYNQAKGEYYGKKTK